MKDYKVKIQLSLLIKDVEDEYEAEEYLNDFLYGLNEFINSSDSEDDHYEILSSQVLI